MLCKVFVRAAVMLLVFLTVNGWTSPQVRAENKTSAPAAESAKPDTDTGKFKGTVRNSQDKYSSREGCEASSTKEVFLRADMSYDPLTGQKNDIEPYYTKESNLSPDEYGRLITSPLVSRRIAPWKSWYCRVFDEIRPKGAIPADLQMKLNVTVDKSGKVLVATEWRNPSKTAAADEYADKLTANIRRAEGQSWIAFPEKSWLDLVKFDLYVTYDRGLQLANGVQRIDYD